MYKTIPAAIVALGLIFGVAGPATSGSIAARPVPARPAGIMVGMDNSDQMSPTYDAPPPPAHSRIFSNFAKYSKGKYICCFGFRVSGPSAAGGQQWLGVSFKPAATTTVKTIELALSFSSGTNAAVITLNSDAGGIPGTTLATFHVSSLPSFGTTGTCCTITTVTSASGVSVTGGQTYWVVVKTDSGSANFIGTWHANEVNQISNQTGAANQSGTWGTSVFKPGLAFAVFGP